MVFLKLMHTESTVNHKIQPDKAPALNTPCREETEKFVDKKFIKQGTIHLKLYRIRIP